MKETNDHLNIDLEFLDKKEPLRVAHESDVHSDRPLNTSSSGSKYNWKNILIIVGVILFFSWAIFSDNNSNTNTNSTSSPMSTAQTQNSSGIVTVGGYSCSSYNASKADSMAPNQSLKQQLDSEQQSLEARSASLKRLGNDIDSTYVDETSQYSVNSYNRMVNEHNASLELFKRDNQSFEIKLDQYNAQVDTYNNFLQINCTKN